ncbi:facilitated trehalose transporter Tret1-like isoform X2 [Planococcus citri]|uniref:facilitated trehalose transporter Tret1-like isoform X2 n=1 Tax=Planococcus citri TaxID=170843 RepID=UPI0031F94C72
MKNSKLSSMLENGCKLKTDKNASEKMNWQNENSHYRSILAQWLATIANSMMFLGVGMMVAIPTVVIGVLHNPNSEIPLSDDETSWFGGLMLLIQPLGCIVAGFLQNYIGRKSGMILMNIPELIAWILMYTATSVNALYVSVIMMGISAGFMEAPGLAYIGEITQPKIRGILTSFANINVTVGLLIEFFLGSVLDWRTAVAVSAVFPLISIVLIAFIPDSPVWLLSKDRKDEALQALCWLRGWVSEDKVKAEFDELCRYTEASRFRGVKDSHNKIYVEVPTKGYVCANGTGIVKPAEKSMSLRIKIFDLFRPSMMRPFCLLLGYQIFFHCAALTGLRCYMIETFSSLNMPIKPQWLAFTSASVMIFGGITCILTVKKVGKRKLSLFSMMACSLGCVVLGIYSLYKDQLDIPWLPTTVFCYLYFSTMVGIGPIPWMLISEVFPVRGRSFGAGVSAASFYMIAFLFTKTYLDLQSLISLHGCFFLYGIGGFVGFVFLYAYLPETEGKTLAEVEDCFTKPKRRSVNIQT